MNPTCSEAFPVTDVEDFASYLGLDGSDADMFYESYYMLNVNEEWTWEWDDEDYLPFLEEVKEWVNNTMPTFRIVWSTS